jgi:endonuclease G
MNRYTRLMKISFTISPFRLPLAALSINMRNNFSRALLCCTLVILFACKKDVPANTGSTPPPTGGGSGSGSGSGGGSGSTTVTDNDNLLLGNPTNAVTSTASMDNYLLNHTYFVEGYSNARGIPLWVSWHLESSDIGSTPRQNNFRADDLLPAGFYLVQNNSYSGSGFDRGHNCPSGDRTSSVAANSSTFYMTNMIPQAPNFNQGPWGNLEDFIRNTIVGSANEAFIVMGSYGSGGTGSNGTFTTINNGNVTVPKKVFKIVVYIPKANDDLNRVDSNAKVLAVNMPNNNSLYTTNSTGQQAWRNYVTTINAIEADAANEGVNYDLLRNVRASVKAYLKTKLYQ